MPELPEVEVSRRGLEPLLRGRRILNADIRQAKLRWPIPPNLAADVRGRRLVGLGRRAKYLLFDLDGPHLILHLGMSGSLRVLSRKQDPGPHDHWDLRFSGGRILRYRDPRRFGALLWAPGDPADHPRLRDLGPEPLSTAFDGAWLYVRSRGRRAAVKSLLMDARQVVGVGNIYANEALFRAGIRPDREAGRISRQRYQKLAEAVVQVLEEALERGGSTLRDFQDPSGEPGYFTQNLDVYGRGGEPCRRCRKPLREIRLGQRSTVYCHHCQR
ncbi:MAG: bifunctional DNA-formamidopyrimidine glycosylase/DNA-(apurinic or apyrimidinic site) lyase [Planctomycetota bacterium]|nr:MAG: bifunctional DNA-formamidopyrimidine glycosylase/DNA-(apurinic or apyrimidinic site) lyase [Planctomycetota bacterium]